MEQTVQFQQHQIILRVTPHLQPIIKDKIHKRDEHTINVVPKDALNPSNEFILEVGEDKYPALLINLPTPLETQKTFDNKIFLKAGDIGQMLHVFETWEELGAFKGKLVKTLNGEYFMSGISPPTFDIVHRRYELTRSNEQYLPYQIRQTTEAVLSHPYLEEAKRQADGEKKEEEEEFVETITEEIVDFEPWMVDPANPEQGRTVQMEGTAWSSPASLFLLSHPQLLVTAEDKEEDSIEEMARAESFKQERRRIGGEMKGDEEERGCGQQGQGAGEEKGEEDEQDKILGAEDDTNQNFEDIMASITEQDAHNKEGMEEGGEGEEAGGQSRYDEQLDEEEDEDEAWMKDL